MEVNRFLVTQAELLVDADESLFEGILCRYLSHGRVPKAKLDCLLHVSYAQLVVLSRHSHTNLLKQ